LPWQSPKPSSRTYHQIYCSILGHDIEHVFGVRISNSQSVDDVKDEIKEKKQNKLAYADELLIYKLPKPLSRGEIAMILGSIVDGADIPNAVPLDTMGHSISLHLQSQECFISS